MARSTIKIEPLKHRNQDCIALRFDYNTEIIDKVKTIDGVRWSASKRCWYIPVAESYRQIIEAALGYTCTLEFKPGQPGTENGETRDYSGSSTIIEGKDANVIEVIVDEKQLTFYIHLPYCFKDDFKKLEGAWWHQDLKLWSATDTIANREQLKAILLEGGLKAEYKIEQYDKSKKGKTPKPKNYNTKGLAELTDAHKAEIEAFKRWMIQKRYAENTIKIYPSCLTYFFRFHANKTIEEIGIKEIEKFNFDYIIKNKYSPKTQNQYISAIKTFYIKMKGINYEIANLERPIQGRKLPRVIPIEHVQTLLSGIGNIKHKTALTTIYSLGLRRSELLNLKLSDISFKRDVVKIRNSKGNKDRDLPLPTSLKQLITIYYRQVKPKIWLIEGQKRGKPYSTTSIGNIFKNNMVKVIKCHNFTLHCLRHSYATHLMDMGVDLRIIQELLGHKSSRTTEIYTHVSMRNLKNVKNPLDGFKLL